MNDIGQADLRQQESNTNPNLYRRRNTGLSFSRGVNLDHEESFEIRELTADEAGCDVINMDYYSDPSEVTIATEYLTIDEALRKASIVDIDEH